MSWRRCAKFEHKIDLYCFLDAYQTGCKRMKLDKLKIFNNLTKEVNDGERIFLKIWEEINIEETFLNNEIKM